MKRSCLALLIASLLSACAVKQPLQRPHFPEHEYSALEKQGTSTVTGQAFLKTRGGDVKTAAGSPVLLNPVTSYSKFAYENRFAPGGLTPIDPRLNDYLRKTTADASGRFSFKNIPAGYYFVTTSVTWEAPTGAGLVRQGGILWKQVEVGNDEVEEIIITQ